MWPLEAVCLPTQWLNRVGMSIHMVVPVSEFSNTFCQLSFSKRALFVRALNHFPQRQALQPLRIGWTICISRLWGLRALAPPSHGGGRANGFSSAFCVCSSGGLSFCRNWCNSVLRKGLWSHFLLWKVIMVGWTSMVWLRVLLLEVRKHQISSLLTRACAYDLSF